MLPFGRQIDFDFLDIPTTVVRDAVMPKLTWVEIKYTNFCNNFSITLQPHYNTVVYITNSV